jgi:hypothetical protein
MAEFGFQWEDFRGGYYVGPSEIKQPSSTWKGYNVTIADDDATLVPTYSPVQLSLTGTGTSSGVIDNGSSQTTWSDPTYFNGYVVVAARVAGVTVYVYFINTSTGFVVRRDLGVVGTVVGSSPVCVPDAGSSGSISAYVVVGDQSIYKVSSTGPGTVTTIGQGYSISIQLHGIVLWNARMIAWSNNSDVIIFSNALDFDSIWPALNFIGVGYANDGVSKCVPRNLDLVAVKPSGWYSITGVMGVSTAVRQMNDTLGILSTDPVEQHNNAVYYTTYVGYTDYAVNLFQIVGGRVDIAAYQRFGLGDSNMKISRTNIGYLGVTALTDDPSGSTYCTMYLMDMQDRWQLQRVSRVMSGATKPRFCLARGQVSRYNNTQDKNLYLVECTTSASDNRMAVTKIRPNTVEPGQTSTTTPSTGVVKLSDITTQRPFVIKEVLVEAEMMQIPTIGAMSAYTGSASLTCYVNNKSVADMSFDDGDQSPTVYSGTMTYPFSDFTSNTSAVTSQVRVIKFRVNNASYMYAGEIELHFSGMRIRRVWMTGDSR